MATKRKQSLYEFLGVAEDASADEIKSAYRRLARRYHPDRNQGDSISAERFTRIKTAYDVLSDPERRNAYDASRPKPSPTRQARTSALRRRPRPTGGATLDIHLNVGELV